MVLYIVVARDHAHSSGGSRPSDKGEGGVGVVNHTLRYVGGPVSKIIFLTLWASICFKNKGEGLDPPPYSSQGKSLARNP